MEGIGLIGLLWISNMKVFEEALNKYNLFLSTALCTSWRQNYFLLNFVSLAQYLKYSMYLNISQMND